MRNMLERSGIRLTALKPGIGGGFARIDVDLADNVAASAFFRAALPEVFRPFVVNRRCVLNELPEGIVIMPGDQRNAEDFFRHELFPEAHIKRTRAPAQWPAPPLMRSVTTPRLMPSHSIEWRRRVISTRWRTNRCEKDNGTV